MTRLLITLQILFIIACILVAIQICRADSIDIKNWHDEYEDDYNQRRQVAVQAEVNKAQEHPDSEETTNCPKCPSE